MKFRGTTVIGVRRFGKSVIGCDGQVTLENTVIKMNAKKIRKIKDGNILLGFAGGVADALAMFERFEKMLERHSELKKAAVELAKEWRTDKYLRTLNAILIVMDKNESFLISGNGEVLQPDDDIIAIGSGGPYALAAARALMRNTELSAREIVEKSLIIASEICIYTNDKIYLEEI
uniref:ATP-dependent protease subunit HslV n=1 Tax=candidate division WOR-3 bacterium TaxID=2052148 RepID=A0A7C4U872_UNCW3